MVGRRSLEAKIGVRIPVPQQGTILHLAPQGERKEFTAAGYRMVPEQQFYILTSEILLCIHPL